ncbi:hypothetical protein MXD81_31370 [Microbacteriaceae bacterium K1510]|nr:hypothetical protein [Microbacteriaceae bacterium K1510]
MIAGIHEHVPAFLDMADVPRWLSVEPDPRDLLRPYPSDLLDVSFAKSMKQRRSLDAGADTRG